MAIPASMVDTNRVPWLRRVGGLLAAGIAGGVIFVACSSDQKSRFPGDATGTGNGIGAGGANSTTGNITGGTAPDNGLVTSASTSGGRPADGADGRIRSLNGQTCAQAEVITAGPAVRDAATPAIGDLDGDGNPEIVTRANFPANNTLIAFT